MIPKPGNGPKANILKWQRDADVRHANQKCECLVGSREKPLRCLNIVLSNDQKLIVQINVCFGTDDDPPHAAFR